jgi:hypothetical protein
MAKLSIIEADTPQISQVPQLHPRIVTALGKQKAGKTYFLRYYVERGAKDRQRPLKLVDADPHNDTLRQHYKDAASPDSSGIEDRRISLERSIDEQLSAAADGRPYDALWDIGGGDLLVPKLARDVQFTDTIEDVGIDLIVFYMLSPSLSDLEYFQTLEDAGFRPKRLGLVFNAGLIQGDRKPDRAFDAMLDQPLVMTLIERGAKPLFMPALAADCVEAVEKTKSVTFHDAISKVGTWHKMRLRTWLDQKMEEEIAKPLGDLGWLI